MDTKETVVDAAIRSFSMFGYKGTTMDQIAKIGGIGKGTIYLAFASKDELFTYILDDISTEMKRIARSELDSDLPFLDKLERAIRSILRQRSKHQLFAKLSSEVKEIGTKKVVVGLQQIEREIVDFIAVELEQAQIRRELASCRSDIVAFVLFRTYTGLLNDWSDEFHPLSDDDIQQVFHDVFVRGLKS